MDTGLRLSREGCGRPGSGGVAGLTSTPVAHTQRAGEPGHLTCCSSSWPFPCRMMLPFSSSSFWVFSNSSFPWRQGTRTGLSQEPPLAWGSSGPHRQPPGGTAGQAQARTAGTRPTAGTASGQLPGGDSFRGPFHQLPAQGRAGHTPGGQAILSAPVPTTESHSNPSPWHTGPVHPSLTTGLWHLLTLNLECSLLGPSAGTRVSALRGTPPPHLLVLFPSPCLEQSLSLLILQNPFAHTGESCFCPGHGSSPVPAGEAQEPSLAGTVRPLMTRPHQLEGLSEGGRGRSLGRGCIWPGRSESGHRASLQPTGAQILF